MNSLSYYAQVVIGNELWVSNIRFNGLFRINIESGESTFVGRFPRYNLENEELHLFAKRYGDKIYFFPKRSDGIDIYDLKTEAFTYAECKAKGINGYVTAINAFYSDEDTVFIVPCYAKMPLQEFSIAKGAVIGNIKLEEANGYIENETNTMALYACKMQDEILYPIHGTNKVGSYHVKEKKEKIYSLDGLKRIKGDIVFDGSDLWINADQGIYQWNPHKDNLKWICDCSSEKESWIEQFIMYGQDMICIPRWLNNVKIIDRKDFRQRNIHISKAILSKKRNIPWRDVREAFVWRNNLIISPVTYKEAVCIDLDSCEVSCKKYESLEALPIKGCFSIREEGEKELHDYIMMISKKKDASGRISDYNAGSRILEKMKLSVSS